MSPAGYVAFALVGVIVGVSLGFLAKCYLRGRPLSSLRKDWKAVTPHHRCAKCGGYATRLIRVGGRPISSMSAAQVGGQLVCADAELCATTVEYADLLKSVL